MTQFPESRVPEHRQDGEGERVIVFGNGFIGHRIARSLPNTLLFRADITDWAEVFGLISTYKAAIVINAAGKTGRPNVDWCESHKEETYRSNVIGALTLASVCAEAKVHLIHLGSGCIFYGPSPHTMTNGFAWSGQHDTGWREDDRPNPLSYYSKTKAAADLCLSSLPNVAVVRLRMPVDSTPHPRNLITKLASYPSVISVTNSVTVVDDLVKVIAALAEKRATGVFHATNPGAVSHREILALYKKYVDPKHECEFIPEGDLVRRGLALGQRSSCVLAGTRLEEHGIHMRPIEEALHDVMKKYAEVRK